MNKLLMAAATSGNQWTAQTSTKAILAYELNSGRVDAEGMTGTSDAAMTIPALADLTQFQIGQLETNAHPTNGHIKRIIYWNRRLPNVWLPGKTK